MRGIFIFSTLITFSNGSSNFRTPEFGASFMRQLITSSDSCQRDMTLLELDRDLSRSLSQSIKTLHADFSATPQRYCQADRYAGVIQSSCLVDYTKFTSEYQQKCKDSDAFFHPVSMLMQCNKDVDEYEIEMINVPSCISHSCDRKEVNNALAKVLDSVGETINNEKSNGWGRLPSCRIFHNLNIQPDADTLLLSSAESSCASVNFFKWTLMLIIGACFYLIGV